MYIFITSLVWIFFFILLKNIEQALCMMYTVHLYIVHLYIVHLYTVHLYIVHLYIVHLYIVHLYIVHLYTVHLYRGFYTQFFLGLLFRRLKYWVQISRDLGLFSKLFFSSDLFSDLSSWDFIGSPHTILGKKVPGIQNTGLYFQWHSDFFPKFLFPGFFRNFFSRDFLT